MNSNNQKAVVSPYNSQKAACFLLIGFPTVRELRQPLSRKEAVFMLCEWCEKQLEDWQVDNDNRFCGTSCSAKWRMSQPDIYKKVHNPEMNAKRGRGRSRWLNSGHPKAIKEKQRIASLNPMSNESVRKKVSKTLRRIGHKPKEQGGNGRGPTVPQKMLYDALGNGWQMEYIQGLGTKQPGYPTHYKIDLANDDLMLGIEVDGYSHKAFKRRAKDAKKDKKLTEFGWKIIRITNDEVLDSLENVLTRIKEITNELR